LFVLCAILDFERWNFWNWYYDVWYKGMEYGIFGFFVLDIHCILGFLWSGWNGEVGIVGKL